MRSLEKFKNQHPTLRGGDGSNARNRITSGLAFVTHLLLFAFGPALLTGIARDFDCRGNQFIPFKDFSSFAQSPGEHTNELVLLSPQITAAIKGNELIVSWNSKLPESSGLKLEARAIYPDHATKYYTMALWSGNPARNPRESTPHQKDPDGDVSTDTLILKNPCDRFQIRLTL